MTEKAIDGVRPQLPPISSNRIQANLLTLGRRLRDAGLPVGSGQILSLVDALATIDFFRHDDVYHAARASVVTRPEQIPVFDLEFSRFWRELLGAKPAPLDPFVPQNTPGEPPLPDVRKKKTERRHTPPGAWEPERRGGAYAQNTPISAIPPPPCVARRATAAPRSGCAARNGRPAPA